MSTPTGTPKFDGTAASSVEYIRGLGLLPIVESHLEVLRTLSKAHGLPFNLAIMVVAMEAKEGMEPHA